MALTDSQKHQVVRVLGYPGTTLVEGSTGYSNIVAGRLTGLNAYIESEVGTLLDRITELDEQLNAALKRTAVKSVDDIEFNGDELSHLRSERRRVLRELATLLDIPMRGGSIHGTIRV